MKTEEYTRLIDSALETFNNHNIEKFMEFYDESAIHTQPTQEKPLKGRDAIRKDYEKSTFIPFPDVKFKKTNIFGHGNWWCVEGIFEGTHKESIEGSNGEMIPATNKKVSVPICLVFKIVNGKVTEAHEYNDQLGFLAQLGL